MTALERIRCAVKIKGCNTGSLKLYMTWFLGEMKLSVAEIFCR